jgi:hypothetical protein
MMDDVETDKNELPHHPDRHAIDDWMLNGPKNGRIEELVRELTLEFGLRLSVVEDIIVNVLLARRNISKRRDSMIDDKSGPEIGAVQLADDVAAQFKMLNEAYATGSAEAIEAAVIKVAEARRMKSNGIADWLASYSDDDAS